MPFERNEERFERALAEAKETLRGLPVGYQERFISDMLVSVMRLRGVSPALYACIEGFYKAVVSFMVLAHQKYRPDRLDLNTADLLPQHEEASRFWLLDEQIARQVHAVLLRAWTNLLSRDDQLEADVDHTVLAPPPADFDKMPGRPSDYSTFRKVVWDLTWRLDPEAGAQIRQRRRGPVE